MDEKQELLRIIEDHLNRHESMQVIDIYKLIHQATHGAAHFEEESIQELALLKEEWNRGERVPRGEQLLEIIDPLGDWMRVNIRIYEKTGGDPETLYRIFCRSRKKSMPDKDRMIRYWEWLSQACGKGWHRIDPDDLEACWIEMGRKGFPPARHSEAYHEANRPSYRLVFRSYWEPWSS